MRVRRFVAAMAAASVGLGVAALVPAPSARADVALVDYSCDTPPVNALVSGLIPDPIVLDDLEVEVVDSPDPVVQGQPLTYGIQLPVPDLTGGLDLPESYSGIQIAPYGTFRVNRILLRVPIPAGLDVPGSGAVTFQPSVPWLTAEKVGNELQFLIQSPVGAPLNPSPMEINLDAAEPLLRIQQSPGVWVPVTPLPDVTITGTATGSPGSSIELKPPALDVNVTYSKSVTVIFPINVISWSNALVPCTPADPNQTITSTAIVAPAPGLTVTKALVSGDDEVTVGETIDYTVTVTNSGNVPLTGVTLADPNASCEAVATTLAVGAHDDVACSHVALGGDVGTYSNTATGDSTETSPVASNTVSTTVGAAAAPAITVTKALVSGDDEVTVGETIDYTVTVTNSGNVPLTGVTLADPNATCEAVATTLAVGAHDDVACTHVAAEGDAGTYSNIATADSSETTAMPSNMVSSTVTDPAPSCLPPQFSDVSAAHAFFNEICWMVDAGITQGYPGGVFKPSASVTRQAMAAFLQRLSNDPTPTSCTQQFSDVVPSHPFFEEICWMVGEGITQGYNDGSFKPGGNVSRAAMAAFLYRFQDEPPFVAPGIETFPDVGTGHTFFEEVEWMVAEGITGGYPDHTFRPGSSVTRQSMAAFLYRLTHPA